MEFLYQYIKNICIFSLVISLVLNIFPESSSKKYIKLFAGIVLLALIVNPIINIKNNSGDIEQIIKNYTYGSLKEENYTLTTLEDFLNYEIDMFTIVLVGNSNTYIKDGKMITPRGYEKKLKV